ncbi:hypothetical protein HY522_05105 [bacterium]|nr:hypothetical protein [bacterium]
MSPKCPLFPTFGHLILPDTTAALDRWVSGLTPEKRLELLLDRMELFSTLRRLPAVNSAPGKKKNGKRTRGRPRR